MGAGKFKIPVDFIIQVDKEIQKSKLDKYDRTIQNLFPEWELERIKKHSGYITLTITKDMRYWAEANSKNSITTDMMEDRLRRLVYLLGI